MKLFAFLFMLAVGWNSVLSADSDNTIIEMIFNSPNEYPPELVEAARTAQEALAAQQDHNEAPPSAVFMEVLIRYREHPNVIPLIADIMQRLQERE